MTDDIRDFAQEMGQEQYVSAKDCVFDATYGNEPKARWWKPISANFKWAMFGRPILSLRKDGLFYVLDGRHRIIALREIFGDDTEFPALVLKGLQVQDEAWMFNHLNIDHRAVPASETFRAALMAKERYAVDIEEVLTSEGIGIIGVTKFEKGAKSSAGGRVAETQAIGTLNRIYKRDGKLALRNVISILKDAWIEEHGAFDRFSLVAVAAFVNKYGKKSKPPTLIRAMRDANPGQLKTSADLLKGTISLGSGSGLEKYGNTILANWSNKKTRGRGTLQIGL